MNNKHLLITLLVSMMAVSAHADVVYEPLIIDSGFNRDVILSQISGDTAISYLKNTNSYWYFATQSVIDRTNSEANLFTNDTVTFNRIRRSGWPDDYRETIRCTSDGDAKDIPLYKDVYWQLAPYTGPNALCIRPDEPSIGGVGSIKFKKVGSYERIFFLLATARDGGNPKREAIARLYYTDGTMVQDTFAFAGLSGATGHNVRLINIRESGGGFEKNKDASKLNAFATVFHLDVEKDKLIHRIQFENQQDKTSVIVLAVTGVTADVEAPEETHISTSNIGDDSFRACWEAIEDAVSYRLDVATDIDFQHILEQYNNKPIDGKYNTCKEVAELEADQDYYWRVRSVNSDGGQSASSAPRRVKTSGGDPVKTEETDNTIEDDLGHFLGNTMSIIINRTLWKDGYFNTLCLPFDLDAAGIAASPLAGGQLYTFDHADVLGEAQLDVHVVPTTTIEAGVPYLIKWANTGEVINNLLFSGVTITADQGLRAGEEGQVQFVGILGKHTLPYENINNLFLGIENTLYWPEDDGTSLKGFRAYFEIPTSGAKAVRRGTPARIIMEQNVATDVEMVNREESIVNNRKFVRNGQLFIVHNGILYNGQGQRVK